MKLILNPTKPIYWDKNLKMFRCGNFPETGKEVEYEGDAFAQLFIKMLNLIEKDELQKIAFNDYSIKQEEFDSVIEYLLSEKFIITEEEYNNLFSSKMYNRQEMYFYMLSDQIKSIKNCEDKKILILGLGGIGSIVSELLARAGFKNFIIIDYDKVDNSNLIRQLAYYSDDIGKLKTDTLLKRIKLINMNCHIEKHNIEILQKKDVEKYIAAADFVVCTLDKPVRKIRRLINDICVKYGKPVIFSGFAEHVGMIGPFVVPNKTACLECIETEMNEEMLYNTPVAPSFGPLCNIIASIVSSEIINYFINYSNNNLEGCTLMFNMYDYSINKIEWKKKNNCKKCGDNK